MASPADRKYAESHEWHKLDGHVVTLGISRFAVDELADVTYVEIKAVGSHVGAGEPVGEVESVKATSEVYSGVSGEIIDVNSSVSEDPSILNRDPYEDGWLCRIRLDDGATLDGLMDHATYDQKYAS